MRYMFGVVKRISLGHLLLSLSAIAMALACILLFALSGLMRDDAIHKLAREDARQTTQLVFQSLYSTMRRGWSKQDINDSIARLNAEFPGLKINVYRGKIVASQFGEMPGEQKVVAGDPALRSALESGKEAMLFPGKEEIRYLYPVQAKAECLSCHTQSHIGAVHGLIDITYPIKNIKVSFNTVLNNMLGYTLLIIALVFLGLYFKLRNYLVRPIATLVAVMREITSDLNLSRRVATDIPLLECQQLADYFNGLLRTLNEYNVRLEELSSHDPMTGLYNRRKFEDFLHYEIIRSTRNQRGFAVIMADLDNFKYVNDAYGRPVGDLMLKELTILIRAGLRKGDVLARLGNDEFAILLPETSLENSFKVANKLHAVLKDTEFELPSGKIRCTASFSLVSFPEDGKTESEIRAAMDAVLFKAKARGKNQVTTAASVTDNDTMMAVFRQGDFLRAALREDRIEAFLQPIVRVVDGAVHAFEVLVRVRDGERIVAAAEFVEIAEQLGMAQELDREVFRKGLAHYAKLQSSHPDALLFFNLFPRSFNDLAWVRGIPALLQSAGVPCNRIVLEITEREALPNMTQVRAVIEELRGTGIRVALDDFGSGFSSFLYLKYLQVDFVKIEGSFVQHIVHDNGDRIMVEHINSMAHQFGLKTVAEFVEDEATANLLQEIGVDYAQGYHYGRPSLPE
ncbi:MAG: EAL domain-containing protein [Gallionella sp.]|nr:EAL domain-containing protein [Gallionella sp.]MDD4946377.1 EAL domain-containing protein [Gallionella sp.]MDD5611733.1 EAL domain-containing protein [Gallionella sp.]